MAKSQAERLWLIGGVVAGFALLVIGYFLLIAPQRSQTTSVNGQVSDVRGQNNVVQSRLAVLRAQNKHLSTYRASLAEAQHALPATSGLPDFLRTLQSLGGATSTHVVSLTVGVPISAKPTSGSTAAPASGTPSSSAPTSGAPSTGAPSAAGAASGTGIYALPITAQVTGSTSALGHFLQQLQEVQPRAVLITQITEGSAPTSTGTTSGAGGSAGNSLQLTMQAFVAPASSPTTSPGTTTP